MGARLGDRCDGWRKGTATRLRDRVGARGRRLPSPGHMACACMAVGHDRGLQGGGGAVGGMQGGGGVGYFCNFDAKQCQTSQKNMVCSIVCLLAHANVTG